MSQTVRCVPLSSPGPSNSSYSTAAMKALKTLLIPSSPPSTKSSVCGYCKKKFKPNDATERYCSVQCERKLDWDLLAAEYARRSKSRTAPPDPDSLIRRAAMESAARGRHGTHTHAPHLARAPDRPSFETEHGLHNSNLVRNNSMPERRRHRMLSHHTPKTSPPSPPLSITSPVKTPLQPLRLPDEQYSYRSKSSSPRSERLYRRAGPDGWSEASSPTSSSPTLVSHSPVAATQRDGKTSLLSVSPPALSRVGRHNRSASDLLFLASPTPARRGSPASHHAFPVVSSAPEGEAPPSSPKTNALGLAVKPFLVRTPSHPPSRANRKKTLDPTESDLPPITVPAPRSCQDQDLGQRTSRRRRRRLGLTRAIGTARSGFGQAMDAPSRGRGRTRSAGS
ncbi:hypothetical protein C8T65DRAFT_65784 [Cerioporus squamosus]|nr:hypothetical protein C8T65DRAFT_65784 [Cerioporus squamosus]